MGAGELHIVHLGKYYPPAPGGIESHVRTLAQAQAALGMRVRVFCVNHVDRHGQDLTWRRHGSTPTRHEYDGLVQVTRLGRSASAAKLDLCPYLPRLLRQLDNTGVDLLHLHTPNPTMLLGLAMAGVRTPVVVTHHSDIIRQRILGLALRPFEWSVYGRAGAIITNSPNYAKGSSLLTRYAQQVRTIPMGIDVQPYMRPSETVKQRAAALRAEYGSPLWLSVGRCVYYKHYHMAIAALAHVPGKLMIIGHGPTRRILQRQAMDLGVADRVIWRNFMDAEELIGAYHAATALWFPSGARSEAYGLVQVEAMASGCPVINANIPDSGVPWVSQHEETGLTIPVGDAGALAAAARRLVSEPSLHQRLSEGAIQRVTQQFEEGMMARRMRKVYREVIEGVASQPQTARTLDHPWKHLPQTGRLKPVHPVPATHGSAPLDDEEERELAL